MSGWPCIQFQSVVIPIACRGGSHHICAMSSSGIPCKLKRPTYPGVKNDSQDLVEPLNLVRHTPCASTNACNGTHRSDVIARERWLRRIGAFCLAEVQTFTCDVGMRTLCRYTVVLRLLVCNGQPVHWLHHMDDTEAPNRECPPCALCDEIRRWKHEPVQA